MSTGSSPRWLTLLTFLATLAACGGDDSARLEHAADGPVLAAIVRGDGFIVPFATYAGGVWSGPDAEPYPDLADRPAPWFADEVDALQRWRLLTPLGLTDAVGDPVPVDVTGAPVEVGTHCQRAWALPTRLPGTSTPEGTVHRDVGVAFTVGARPLLVAEIDVTLDDMNRAVAFLAPYFNAAEVQETRRRDDSGEYEPRRVGSDAASSPLAIRMLSRVGGGGGVSYYAFEASRMYPAGAGALPGCDEATVMTGWMSESEHGVFALLGSDLHVTNCDRKGSPRIQPVGALTLDGHLFVVVVERHYEGESYAVVRVNPAAATTVLTVYGGGY